MRFFAKFCGTGEGGQNLGSFRENYSSTSHTVYKTKSSPRRRHYPHQHIAYISLPLLLVFFLIVCPVHLKALQTMHGIINTRISRMRASSPFQFAILHKTQNHKIFSRPILYSTCWQLNHELGKQYRACTGLFSHETRYLDQLAISATVSSIPKHKIEFPTSSSHHKASNPISEIISQSSQVFLDHVNQRNGEEIERNTKCWEKIFTFDLPEGKCVGVRLSDLPPTHPSSLELTQINSNKDHWVKQLLHPDEVKFGIDLATESSRMTFYLGRLAMRTALNLVRCEDKSCNVGMIASVFFKYQQSKLLPHSSILKDEHGRPQVPKGFLGSISHKQRTGVALVSPRHIGSSLPKQGIGVDIEQTYSKRINIAKKVLTIGERNDLGKLNGVTRDEEVLLRFSLKECVYKAMHPLICQWVGFQEAEITPHDDGTAVVKLNLKNGAHNRFQDVKAHWQRIAIDGDFFLTSSSVTLKEEFD